ncbi:MAG TPA: RNase H family protein [Armatimonadota bacterium]|nr:RNase H family protein [Armatimonadota bacterium]
MTIDFYTDGACPGNGKSPQGGPMGAGIVGRSGDIQREWAIPLGRGTNQKAELLAIREALLKVRDRPNTTVRIHTDSAYAIGCLTKDWKVKANVELVDEVRRLARECRRFEMRKVAGHSGVAANERADELAVRAAVTGQAYSSAPSADPSA